jgi:transcriptional regulator with XRE-family HTH domain
VVTKPAKLSKLREWRTRHQLKLEEVADLDGTLDVSTLSRVERGQRHLSPMQQVHLARALGVNIRDIFDPNETSHAPRRRDETPSMPRRGEE